MRKDLDNPKNKDYPKTYEDFENMEKDFFNEDKERTKANNTAKKRLIAVILLVAVVAVSAVWELINRDPNQVTYFVQINCNAVNEYVKDTGFTTDDEMLFARIKSLPVDGVCLAKYRFLGKGGETLGMVTQKTLSNSEIEYYKAYNQVYNGLAFHTIGYLQSGDINPRSCWMYSLNDGEWQVTGFDNIELHNKDVVTWAFSIEGDGSDL